VDPRDDNRLRHGAILNLPVLHETIGNLRTLL